MKILVTGGAGFIGSHVVDEYIKADHEVVVIDDFSTGKKENLNPKAKFYQADICDKKAVDNILREEKPQLLNHHAAQMSVRDSVKDPIFDARVNIFGLLNLLESGKRMFKKIIFASSGGVVYGNTSVLSTPEDYEPKRPVSPYGITKLASEHYLNFYYSEYGIPYVALRYGNVYGPRQNPHGEAGVVAIFSKKLIHNEQPVINGDGEQTRDYVYVGDVARANVSTVNDNIRGEFNIGTGIETSVNDIFHHLVEITGTKIEELHGPAKPGEQIRSCLSANKAKDVFNWFPKVGLREGLEKTVDFFRSESNL